MSRTWPPLLACGATGPYEVTGDDAMDGYTAAHPSVEAVARVQCITEGCSPGSDGSCGAALLDDRPRPCLTADADSAPEPTGLAYEASEAPAFYARNFDR